LARTVGSYHSSLRRSESLSLAGWVNEFCVRYRVQIRVEASTSCFPVAYLENGGGMSSMFANAFIERASLLARSLSSIQFSCLCFTPVVTSLLTRGGSFRFYRPAEDGDGCSRSRCASSNATAVDVDCFVSSSGVSVVVSPSVPTLALRLTRKSAAAAIQSTLRSGPHFFFHVFVIALVSF
jgi:hypothetical protein